MDNETITGGQESPVCPKFKQFQWKPEEASWCSQMQSDDHHWIHLHPTEIHEDRFHKHETVWTVQTLNTCSLHEEAFLKTHDQIICETSVSSIKSNGDIQSSHITKAGCVDGCCLTISSLFL